ncbi:calcium-binding protein [Microvirga sp. 2YAF29]|uniref:calcium-binding protein n=1 Tax=Microvirga sp. 2YAF29 TaxID=3233031 RepID=UPI003F9779B7
MATVTFTADTPEDLRLPKLFTEILGAIVFGRSGGDDTAAFKVQHPDGYIGHQLDVFYSGRQLSVDEGEVSYLRFSYDGDTWLTIGTPSGPVLFTYSDLQAFHRGGAIAAAAVLSRSDNLTGSAKGDYMESYAGDDVLDGGEGADTLKGGSGNDIYIVDNSADRVVEDVGGGYDIVETDVDFALAEDSEVEVLRASLAAVSLSLIGNQFANLIIGTHGDDLLDGKGGVDTLIGKAGNDIYLVDNPFDIVQEIAGEGYDTVITTASYRLSYNVEVLKAAAGTSMLVLEGNALANEIFGNTGIDFIYGHDGDDSLYGDGGNDVIFGGTGNDLIFGGMGDDHMEGGEGYDIIYGDVGNDALIGGGGDDTLYGGPGNDYFRGDDGNDQLFGDVGNDTLYGGAGNDLLYGGLDINKLYGENGNDLLFGGEHVDTLVGGAGNDQLFGDAGNDYLDGGPGRDTLWGGPGRDSFVFRDRLNAKTNVDNIRDFQIKVDKIRLENAIFKKLGKAGKLKPDFFTIGISAKDANDHIVFNKKAGLLSYDADGTGPIKAIAFARFVSKIGLDAGDFLVI